MCRFTSLQLTRLTLGEALCLKTFMVVSLVRDSNHNKIKTEVCVYDQCIVPTQTLWFRVL